MIKFAKNKGRVRVNGRTLTTETLQDRGPVISKLEEVLVRWITRDTAISGDITNITDKIRLGIRISAFRLILERLKQLCQQNPNSPKSTPEPTVLGAAVVNMDFILGAAVDPSTVWFYRCANMTEEYFNKASSTSPHKYDLILHLGSREDFQVFAAYRASESFAHPVIFKGEFKK